MSTGRHDFPIVHSVVMQKRSGIWKKEIQVHASAEGLPWHHITNEVKVLKNWRETKSFLPNKISGNSWVYQQIVSSPANPTHSAEETYENSAEGTQELLSVEGNNLAFN